MLIVSFYYPFVTWETDLRTKKKVARLGSDPGGLASRPGGMMSMLCGTSLEH